MLPFAKSFFRGKHAPVSRGIAVNINQIKYFVSVVECGSFSSAAAEQFITAQGMSKSIADLESEIGAQLLVRKNRGVVPTDFGYEFYERAQLVMGCYEDLESFARNHRNKTAGTSVFSVYICIPAFGSKEKVSVNVAKFISTNLGIETEIHFGSKANALRPSTAAMQTRSSPSAKPTLPATIAYPSGSFPAGSRYPSATLSRSSPTYALPSSERPSIR